MWPNPNPILQMFGNMQNFQQQFIQFQQQFSKTKQNPQEVVQQLMQSGQMTQEQFNRFSPIADMITGKRPF